MNRASEIELALRDSILVSVSIEYEYYSEFLKQPNSIEMKFIRHEKEVIELKLFDVRETDIYDDFTGSCISHIKAFSKNESVTLSLDPFDERVDAIEEKDNFVFTAKEYRLNVSQV